MPEINHTYPSPEQNPLIAGLNPKQKEAVLHESGPLLVLAGAGSGKTRVITHRIAYLISERGLHPSQILAITFTNKAAREMKERIIKLLGDAGQGMWIGTFHSMFLRILRQHAELLGFKQNFAIYDPSDSEQLLKQLMKDLKISEQHYTPRSILSKISYAKSRMISAEAYQEQAEKGYDLLAKVAAQLYTAMMERMREENAMDFDDILNYSVQLLQDFPKLRQVYQERFRHILVDEYQDSNRAQYLLVHLLAGKDGNLCVVGDDDQSIYAFRGADLNNILDFERDYPGAKVVKLEQNYRSTELILAAANGVIACNNDRKAKRLWTETEGGERVIVYCADDNYDEARYVAGEVKRLVQMGHNINEIAILYRINALSRNLEFALREQGVPYRVYGGTGFYERAEIKTAMAYLRFIQDSSDFNALRRVLTVPKRGVGEVGLQNLANAAAAGDGDLLKVILDPAGKADLKRVANRLGTLAEAILELRAKLKSDLSFADWMQEFLNHSGLKAHYEKEAKEGSVEAAARLENLSELLSDAVEFEEQQRAEWAELKASMAGLGELSEDALSPAETQILATEDLDLGFLLSSFLERAALFTSLDEENQDNVTLLTTHSAKGAEYKIVFIVGVEEGIFPSFRSLDDPRALEEERRICYVGMTRAEQRLIMTYARNRLLYGQTKYCTPSRFLGEIPDDCVVTLGGERKVGVSEAESAAGARGYRLNGQAATSDRKSKSQGFAFNFGVGQNKPEKKNKAKSKAKSGTEWRSLKQNQDYIHPQHGRGTVIEVLALGQDAIVTMDFGGKTRRFLAGQCKLEAAD
ncbi:MAG: UvrD-helicase domain-containing protein [Eubacteriales bacterium]|nr:UvrD-helicase domain-containing protein [Eubacteriales bacterium]